MFDRLTHRPRGHGSGLDLNTRFFLGLILRRPHSRRHLTAAPQGKARLEGEAQPSPSDYTPAMTRLYTIGYQGASIDGLIAALKTAGVETLIDVRAVPASRRPEFSKRNLTASLEAAGLTYVHLVGLGNPKEGRDAGE